MKKRIIKITANLIIVLSLLIALTLNAAGETVYTNTRWLADNLEYTNTITWDSAAGRTESFTVRMTGQGDAYPIVMNGDTIFGGFEISRMVSYAESLGKNVLAVVNTDFFAYSTVPIGIVVEDGVYKSSPGGRNAVTFGYDNTVGILEAPSVLISLYNNGSAEDAGNAGKTASFSNFNKVRSDAGGLILYSEAFSSVSTRTSSPGWFVRFRIIEGVPSVSGTMTLEVIETLATANEAYIGEGNLVLSAADASNLASEYEKFSVGDVVTLTTTCSDARLANAQFATGGGDVLVSNGVITDSSAWTQTLMPRAPRTAFGFRADGTVVSFVVDGRNPTHSIGMTLEELADEMKRQGCIYAVNFDGGGSTALSVRIPGDNKALVVNRPSDSQERACATYMLFVTDAAPDGVARNLSLRNDGAIVLAESSLDLKFTATDRGYKPASIPRDITAAAMDPGASVSGTLYTAGSMAGTDRISLYSASARAYGIGEVHVITQPTSITVSMKDSTEPLTSVVLSPGEMIELGVTATYYRREVTAQPHSFTYTVEGDIGEMTEPGIFIAGSEGLQTGTITVSAGGRSTVLRVEISEVEIGRFEDMQNHWAEEYADFLLQAGITRGVTDTLYGPSQLMKRGDFILMLHRAAGEPEASVFSSFDDVPGEMYYSQALEWARRAGIAEGADGNNFYPQMPLTRQDAFTFTYRALSILNKLYPDGTTEDLAGFTDAELVNDYAVIPTATLISLGVVDGIDGTLSPHATMTRAQMAKVLAIVLQL